MQSGAFAINKEAPEGATKMPKGIKIVDKKSLSTFCLSKK